MNGRSAQWRWLAVLALSAMAACKGKDVVKPEDAAAIKKDQYAIDSARMALDLASEATPSELAGSHWQLVQLRGVRDSVFTPEAATVYTLEFGSDGQAIVVGGCNRGGGTFAVTRPSGLTFGPLATTRAMCPPGSISARYLGDFARMRSYQLVGGHLFISLADNGGIYEFAPEPPKSLAEAGPDPVAFSCTDSTGARTRVIAEFSKSADGKGKVTVRSKGKQFVLPQVASGSGARYEGSGVMLWNKGRDAMVSWQGVNLNCSGNPE